MYSRRRVLGRYRKKVYKNQVIEINNKLQATQAYNELVSVPLLSYLQTSKLWMKYAPIRFTFRLYGGDRYNSNHYFYFTNCIFSHIYHTMDFEEKTSELNQWFFRNDIREAYDFMIQSCNGMQFVISRKNAYNDNVSLKGDESDFVIEQDVFVKLKDVIDGGIWFSNPKLVTYEYEYYDDHNPPQPTGVKNYEVYWTFQIEYQETPSPTHRFHYMTFSQYNKHLSSDQEPEKNDACFPVFWLYPAMRTTPSPYEDYYSVHSGIDFLLLPKGLYQENLFSTRHFLTVKKYDDE